MISIAIVTALTALVLIMPLRRAAKPVTDGFAHDAEVYRDQLAELECDETDGLISPEEAEYARGEIGRRLLAANAKTKRGADGKAQGARSWLMQIALFVLVPVIGVGLYMKEGMPELPDQPLEVRLANPGKNIGLLVVKMERHLAQNPEDGEGWKIVAPVYARTEQFDKAANAYRNAIRLLPPDADLYGSLGESLLAMANGQVTPDAQAAFQKSLELNRDNPRAEFYLALALAQAGRVGDARDAYEALLGKSPPDAPWVPLVQRAIAELNSPANPDAPRNPDAADMQAMQDMSPQDRQDFIRTMVTQLDERLTENPDNFEGWVRLIRSYMVLKDEAKAKDALQRALKQFPADKEQGKALVAQANQLGVTIEGVTHEP